MRNRTIRSIDKQLAECLENLNTWAVSINNLVDLKYRLLHKKTDLHLKSITKRIMQHHYKNNKSDNESMISSDSSDSDDSNDLDDSDNVSRKSSKSSKSNGRSDSNDSNDSNVEVEVEVEMSDNEHKSVEKKTRKTMEEQALELLAQKEKEEKDMDDHMDRCRRQMHKDMEKEQPKKEIKFTLVTGDEDRKKSNVEDEDCEDGEVVAEVIEVDDEVENDNNDNDTEVEVEVEVEVENDNNDNNNDTEVEVEVENDNNNNNNNNDTEVEVEVEVEVENEVEAKTEHVINTDGLDLHTSDPNVMLSVINDALGVPNNLRADNLETDIMPSFKINLPKVTQSDKKPEVKFRTTLDDNPPPITALHKLTLQQQEKLFTELYYKAKNNVRSMMPEDTDKKIFDEMVKRETDRLLDAWIKTH
jgi:hypothetical protein